MKKMRNLICPKMKSEICVPLVKPGCALDDMLLYDDYHNRKINMTGEAPN